MIIEQINGVVLSWWLRDCNELCRSYIHFPLDLVSYRLCCVANCVTMACMESFYQMLTKNYALVEKTKSIFPRV